jgi:cbb3-type cytochrome oxidase maturation protein
MESLILLVPLALLLGLLGLFGFLWCLRSGQYDDLDGAAARILFDDPPANRMFDDIPAHQSHAPSHPRQEPPP